MLMNNSSNKGSALLLTVNDVLAIVQMGRSTWFRLVSSGKAPLPVKIGRTSRWPLNVIEEWIAAGCPPRWKQGK